jgi:hypothetical protein
MRNAGIFATIVATFMAGTIVYWQYAGKSKPTPAPATPGTAQLGTNKKDSNESGLGLGYFNPPTTSLPQGGGTDDDTDDDTDNDTGDGNTNDEDLGGVTAGVLSKSKLGIFMLIHYNQGPQNIMQRGPRVVKVIDPHLNTSMLEAVRQYKTDFSGGTAILRFYDGTTNLKYAVTDDPVSSATDFFNKVLKPGYTALGGDISLFDYMATPNEYENTPDWKGEANLKWNGKFWKKLTELNEGAGIKTCVGSVPVGNLEPGELQFIVEDLKAMNGMGASFCYNGYGFDYNKDISREQDLTLRYRKFYDYYAANAPELSGMPLILGEIAVAEGGDPLTGYLKNGNEESFKDWLIWVDSEIQKDSYVVGGTIFQIGDIYTWEHFNLDPISNWFSNYLEQNK